MVRSSAVWELKGRKTNGIPHVFLLLCLFPLLEPILTCSTRCTFRAITLTHSSVLRGEREGEMGEGRGVTYRMIREVERARVERRVVRTDERIASMISCKFER